jgi:hypothetical protein
MGEMEVKVIQEEEKTARCRVLAERGVEWDGRGKG